MTHVLSVPRHPNTSLEGVLGRFGGSKYRTSGGGPGCLGSAVVFLENCQEVGADRGFLFAENQGPLPSMQQGWRAGKGGES